MARRIESTACVLEFKSAVRPVVAVSLNEFQQLETGAGLSEGVIEFLASLGELLRDLLSNVRPSHSVQFKKSTGVRRGDLSVPLQILAICCRLQALGLFAVPGRLRQEYRLSIMAVLPLTIVQGGELL